jgi:hypothetical protein
MELFHTSPDKIEKVNPFGLFGDCLCFSGRPYFMTEAPAPVVYKIELDDSEIVEASSFFYRDDCDKLSGLVEEVMELVGCDEDTAQDLLAGTQSLLSVADEYDPEMDFEIQKLTGKAGKVLGFRAVETRDEQGAMWLVSMSGHEQDLIEVE